MLSVFSNGEGAVHTSDGVTIFFRTEGKGPTTLLFVHGWGEMDRDLFGIPSSAASVTTTCAWSRWIYVATAAPPLDNSMVTSSPCPGPA